MALTTGLIVCTAGAVTSDTPVTSLVISNGALEIACDWTGIDCVGLAAPHVDYPESLAWWGWLGAYSYEDDPTGVWLHPDFMGRLRDPAAFDLFAFSILLHETVHYIYYQTFGVDDPDITSTASRCASERLAWSIANTWLISVGLGQLADYHWAERYEGCEL